MDRRKFLFTTVATGATALSGCSGLVDDDPGLTAAPAPAGTPPSSNPTPNPSPTPSPASPAPAPGTPSPAPSTPAPAPAPSPATPAANPPGVPPPPPQPAWPPQRPAEVSVALYENNIGLAHRDSYLQMYWQSALVTRDGTLIEWGTGDHGPTSDNGVREFDPVTGIQSYVYPNNNGTRDQSQYDNLHYFSIPRIDSLVIPSRGQYHRGSGRWLIGNLISNGRSVVGTGSGDLFRPINAVDREQYYATFNAHQAWSGALDCGVCISGGNGGDSFARTRMWIIAPSSGFGSFEQPYVIFERTLPASAGGAAPNKSSGRDGCCFAGDYVYWVGGWESNTQNMSRHFFRMRITPHLTSTTATLAIERLPDAPAAFHMGLLRYDPHTNALLCISGEGIFVFDIAAWSWANVTPAAYRDEYAPAPTNGLLPRGCMGDFVESRSGQTIRKIIWRPGFNHSWGYDYGGTQQERMYRRFRAIRLVRR